MIDQQPNQPTQPHLLIVDDHREIRSSLNDYLSQHGYRITVTESAAAARAVLSQHAIDLLVLDIMMPGEDGLSLCRDLRASGELPIILLTAMVEETDRVVGLEMGADDYLTKPFNPRELLARIKSVLRRTHALPPSRQMASASSYTFDRWTLDSRRRELIDADGVVVPLSSAEHTLLTALLERPHMILSRDQLMDITRGREAGAFDRSIDTQISRLRKKIEMNPKQPTLIVTHWGGGYSFEANVTHQ